MKGGLNKEGERPMRRCSVVEVLIPSLVILLLDLMAKEP